MSFETLRGKPRIVVFGKARKRYHDFDEYVSATPYSPSASLETASSLAGLQQVLGKAIFGGVRLQAEGISEDAKQVWEQIFRTYLSQGVPIDVIMDRARGMRWPGDDIRDAASGWGPISVAANYTLDGFGALEGCGGIGMFPAVAYGWERIELLKNGDLVDGSELALPTNWTNETTGTLNAAKLRYLGPGLDQGRTKDMPVLAIQALADGNKTLAVAFDFGDYDGGAVQYDSMPNGAMKCSFLARIDMEPDRLATLNGGGNEVLSVSIRATSHASSTRDSTTDIQLSTNWTRHFITLTPATASSSNTGHVLFEPTDDLAGHCIYLADVRLTGAEYWSGPAPYSSTRSGATGLATQGHTAFLNRLAYAHQVASWEASEDFGFTFSCWFTPFWSSAAGSRGPEFSIQAGRNNKIDFEENGSPYAATVTGGQYSAADLAIAITDALNAVAPANTYSCTYSTSTNKFTISRATGTDTIDFLWNTGDNVLTSIAATIGFSTAADDTGATSYAADTADTGALTLIQTCDTTLVGNRGALWVYVTSQKVYASLLLADGTVATLSASHTFTAGAAVHIIYSASDDGSHELFVNNSSAASATGLSDKIASMGKFLLLGSHVSTVGAPCGVLSDVRLDPVHIDGSTYTSADFYLASGQPERFQHVWRCKLDRRGQQPVRFNDRKERHDLDAVLVEDVTFPVL